MFDKIIELQHDGYTRSDKHNTDLLPSNLIGGDDLDERYVMSCRVRVGRSIKGYCLPPFCTRAERRAVETVILAATDKLTGEFEGKYYNEKSGILNALRHAFTFNSHHLLNEIKLKVMNLKFISSMF